MAALQSLNQMYCGNYLINQVRRNAKGSPGTMPFAWSPSHVGMYGEIADDAAKRSLLLTDITKIATPSRDLTAVVREHFNESWKQARTDGINSMKELKNNTTH